MSPIACPRFSISSKNTSAHLERQLGKVSVQENDFARTRTRCLTMIHCPPNETNRPAGWRQPDQPLTVDVHFHGNPCSLDPFYDISASDRPTDWLPPAAAGEVILV
jgi:hypothetical protein